MSRSVVGVCANKALYVAGAFAVSLFIFAFAASTAEAAPTTASWYGPGFAGNTTASGETFDPSALTAAHKTLPFGTQVRICDDACAVVTINDRGPYANGAEYDLSRGAAEAVGLIEEGVGTVDATVLGQGGGDSGSAAATSPEPAPEPRAAASQQSPAPQTAAPQAVAPQQSEPESAGAASGQYGGGPAGFSGVPAAAESEPVASAASQGALTQSSTQNASGSNISQSTQQSQNVVGDISVSGGQSVSISQGGF